MICGGHNKLIIFLIAISVVSIASIAHSKNTGYGRFVDPLKGVSFAVPENASEIEMGFGELVSLIKIGGMSSANVKVYLRKTKPKSAGKQAAKEVLSQEYKDATLVSSDEADIGNLKYTSVAYKREGRGMDRQGVIMFAASGSGLAEVVCESVAPRFLETLFECRQLAASLNTVAIELGSGGKSAVVKFSDMGILPSPELLNQMSNQLAMEPASYSLAYNLAQAKSMFAIMDERRGCSGVGDDARRFSNTAAKFADSSRQSLMPSLAIILDGTAPANSISCSSPFECALLAILGSGRISYAALNEAQSVSGGGASELIDFARAKMLLREGRIESSAKIFERLAQGRNGFFAEVALAEIDLEKNDIAAARKRLSNIGGGSNMAAALRVASAAAEGNLERAADYFDSLGTPLCGRAGAFAAYHFGMGIVSEDIAKAETYLEDAIKADPSFVPPYIALSRMLLERGAGASTAMQKIKTLLAKAPNSEEISRLKKRMEGVIR